MADTATNAQMKSYFEEITHTANDATMPGSLYEQQLINKAYMKTAYKYDWQQTLKRWFDPLLANVDRYALQSDFRKFKFIYSQGSKLTKTELEFLNRGFGEYAVAPDSLEYMLSTFPSLTTPTFNIQGSVSAGASVVVTLDTVTGISAGDEIFIADTTLSEFTKVQGVDSVGVTITIKLANSHSAKPLYRTADGNYFQYQKTITPLSDSGDVPVLPGETHLVIPHYAASLYYSDIQEEDEAASHLGIWTRDIDEAWFAFDKLTAGESGQFTL